MKRDNSLVTGLLGLSALALARCSTSGASGTTDAAASFDAGSGGFTSGGSGGGISSGGSSGSGTGGSSAGGSGGSSAGGNGGSVDGGSEPDASSGSIDGGFSGDTYLPWAGGAEYFATWSNGPPSEASFFPIGVWLQSPSNATRYEAIGINLFIGLWQGPTDTQLADLAAAGMPTFCAQSGVWNTHLDDSTIWGWLQPDEPDNAQANASGGYDPCVDPNLVIADYDTMVANDPTRPVWLNLGRGVSDTTWIGRGDCTGNTAMYAEYQKAADILSFDIYPVNDGIGLEAVPNGVDNLREWSNYAKPVIADIEGSNIDNTTRPTPAQIRSEVWMAVVHGAAGIMYFCHRFSPTFSETDCLDDTTTAAGITDINAQVTELAPVLNQPSVGNGVTVTSSSTDRPVDTMLKRYDGATYLFAAEMRDGATTATFTLRDFPPAASAEVLGETRTLTVTNGVFQDDFDGYGVHLYRIVE